MSNWFSSNINEKWWNWKNTDFTIRDICEASEYDTRFPEKKGDFISDDPVEAFFASFVNLVGYKETIYNGEYIPEFKYNYFEKPYQDYFENLSIRAIGLTGDDELDEVLGNTKLKDFNLKEDLLNFLDYSMRKEIFNWDLFEDYALTYFAVKGKEVKFINDNDLKKLSKKYGWS